MEMVYATLQDHLDQSGLSLFVWKQCVRKSGVTPIDDVRGKCSSDHSCTSSSIAFVVAIIVRCKMHAINIVIGYLLLDR